MPTIYVSMEGGICQGVSSNDPALAGLDFVIIDYDVEGATDDEVSEIVQPDGTIAEAIIGGGYVDLLQIQIRGR